MATENGTVERAGEALDPEQLIARVQELTARLESMTDPAARELAEELTAAVVQMYGAGLERIVAAVAAAGAAGDPIRTAMTEDGVVASLLLIHDLYPVSLEDRVAQALERVRPYMESHGGDVELLGIAGGIAHLRLQGSCRSCSASSATLELAVRQALEDAAPDLGGMEVDGVVEPELELRLAEGGPGAGGVELPMANGGAPAAPSWFELAGAGAIAPEEFARAEVAGTALVVANVEGTLLAYRDRCAGCGSELHGGELAAGALRCPGCRRSYFLPRAGRSLDDEALQLDPVPLLRDGDTVKVALSA